MDTTITAAWIAAVAGFVIFLFNWIWLFYVDHRTGRRIRTMISIEINDNLLHLSEFMKFVEAQGQNLGGIAAALQQDALELYELHAWNRKI